MGRRRNSGAGKWGLVGRLAGEQHGVVSREQLRGLGFGEDEVDYAIASERLYPIFRGVFGVGHLPATRAARLRAATLACGEGSVVSHGTAAALLGLWRSWPGSVDVIAPVEAGRKIGGIRRRHVPAPGPRERVACEGVPCTGPSRTIIDVAGGSREHSLRGTVEQAAVLGVLDVVEIESILEAGPRRRGSPLLRTILDDWRRYPSHLRLRSRMEAKLLPLLTRRGIPIPRVNEYLYVSGERFELDFLWPEARLVVETDGRRYHGNPFAQARDDRRNRALRAAGYEVRRLSWGDLEDRPEATMNHLARLLAAPKPHPAVP